MSNLALGYQAQLEKNDTLKVGTKLGANSLFCCSVHISVLH